jgi:pyruvate ferredoxin oxidoreductase alpha subunit
MYVNKKSVPTVGYVYGIGGRDVTTKDIEKVYKDLEYIANTGDMGIPYRYLGLRG